LSPHRLDNLQAIRGVACLLVVAAHAAIWEERFGPPASHARTAGYIVAQFSIDLLFVTSGFILTYTYFGPGRRAGGVGAYLSRRVWRVFPTYWAALALAAAVHTLVAGDPLPPPGWGYVADMAWLRPRAEHPAVLPVVWSMTYEVLFYAAFALAFVLPRRATVVAAVGWAAVVAAARAGGVVPENTTLRHLVFPYMLELLAGCLAARLAVRDRVFPWPAMAAGGAWLVAGVAVATLVYPPFINNRLVLLGVPAVLLVYGAATLERYGWRGPWWICRVGDRSYSIYLVHWIAQAAVFHVTFRAGISPTGTGRAAWYGMMIAAGLGAGLVFYRLVEKPLADMARGRRPAGGTPAPHAARRAGVGSAVRAALAGLLGHHRLPSRRKGRSAA
jgi:peptidoglycan/LPS O-acetylase OafA/YrhL